MYDVRNYASRYALNLCLQPTIKWFPLLPYSNATASPHFQHGHNQLSQPSGLTQARLFCDDDRTIISHDI